MSKREILVGATDQTIDIFIQDSSSTTGQGLAGLVFDSAGLACYYRKGATGSATALTLATQTVGGAHSDGGFVEIQATNMKGVYRLDLSDTIVAAAGMVTIMLYGATNMAPVVAEIEVVNVNKFDAVRMGMTALPNAAADAAGGLVISDAGGFDIDNRSLASAAVTNANTVFNTDFATNYDATNDRWKVDAMAISGDATAADALEAMLDSAVTGTADSGTTTTMVDAARTEADTDYWAGSWILFTSGTIAGQCRLITGFTPASDTITFAPATTQAVSTNTYEIIPAAKVSGVTLVDTLTTYTGNTPQTGDSYAIVNSGTHGNAAIKGYVDDIGVAGAGLTGIPWNASWDAEVQSEVQDALDGTIADSVPADGTRPSISSGIYMICQGLFEGAISGTTWTIKKVDGSTTLMTVTLDSSTTPTSKTRSG